MAWKEGYALVGEFVNNSRFAAVATLAIEISEVRSEENPHLNPCDYLPVQVNARNNISARGGRISFSFNFLHDWSWLTPAVYVIYGPMNKRFVYAVWFQCTDDANTLFDPKKAAAWADAMVAGGLSSPMLRGMAEAGLSPEQINELAALVTHEWLLELVKEKGLFLVPFVASLQRFVQEVQGQRVAVLAGETYIVVHRPRERFSERPHVDAEAQLRPRGNEPRDHGVRHD